MSEPIDISPSQRKELLALIQKHLPNIEVWAFGSRVKWTARSNSDLDLVAFSKPEDESRVSRLKEALEESSLPFRVDLLVWDNIPESFKKNIQERYVVLVNAKTVGHDLTPEWVDIRLGDACKKIGSGATPRGGGSVYLDAGPIAFIRSQNIYNEGFSKDGMVYLDEKLAQGLANVQVEELDVLLNITGDSVARACQVISEVLPARVNQHVAIIRTNQQILWPTYLRYFLVSPAMQAHMLGMAAVGATRNALTKGMIESFSIRCPKEVDAQKAIADALSSLDKKIEINHRINQTLEAMAQAIFQSWFVDFDPVKAKIAAKAEGRDPLRAAMSAISGKVDAELDTLPPEAFDALAATAALFPDEMEESELGAIPRGWEIQRVGDLLELAYGKALKSTDRKEGVVPVYGSGGVTGNHNVALVPKGSIIVGRKGTVGSLYWEDGPFFPIDTTYYVRPLTVPLTHCYYAMQTLGLEKMNTDAAVPGLNRENVYRLEIVRPDSAVLQQFDVEVSTLRKAIHANADANKVLGDLRDTLLPKLLSGELSVENLSSNLETMA